MERLFKDLLCGYAPVKCPFKSFVYFLINFLAFFLAALQAVYESLIPQPGIKPTPPPFKAQSPNPLMATETPSCFFSVLWVFLYTLGTNPLSDKCVLNISSHYVAYLFILLMLP